MGGPLGSARDAFRLAARPGDRLVGKSMGRSLPFSHHKDNTVKDMTNEIIRTGVYTRSGNKRFDLDDPKQRLRLTKYMTPAQRERFAKDYVRKVLAAKEQELWFKRMVMK
jgi:hypothetical protein